MSPCIDLCTGVYLSLKGTVYANDSAVSVREIGKQNNGLHCITDKRSCCMTVVRTGEWLFSNGSRVPDAYDSSSRSFYTSRGDDGTVTLNRLNSNVTSPTGLFCCVVPDATDTLQTVCIYISKLKTSKLVCSHVCEVT